MKQHLGKVSGLIYVRADIKRVKNLHRQYAQGLNFCQENFAGPSLILDGNVILAYAGAGSAFLAAEAAAEKLWRRSAGRG